MQFRKSVFYITLNWNVVSIVYIHLSCLLDLIYLEDHLILCPCFPRVKAPCLIRNMYVHEHYIIILKWNVNSFLFVLYFSMLFWHYMCLYSVLSITLHLISFHLVSFHFVLFVFVLFSCWCLHGFFFFHFLLLLLCQPTPFFIRHQHTFLHFFLLRLFFRLHLEPSPTSPSLCLICGTERKHITKLCWNEK